MRWRMFNVLCLPSERRKKMLPIFNPLTSCECRNMHRPGVRVITRFCIFVTLYYLLAVTYASAHNSIEGWGRGGGIWSRRMNSDSARWEQLKIYGRGFNRAVGVIMMMMVAMMTTTASNALSPITSMKVSRLKSLEHCTDFVLPFSSRRRVFW